MNPTRSNQDGLPRAFGGYDLLEVVGRGGFGVIYRARDRQLGRICAIKLLAEETTRDEGASGLLLHEARAAAGLNHPNIVAIYKVGEVDGQPYLSMEFIEGMNLASLTREHILSAETVAVYVQKIAAAIDFAHSRRVLHCDLKPGNVIVDLKNEPRVTDFGLSRPTHGVMSGHGQTTVAAGTPNFMAPEQLDARFGAVGRRTDVYGLGTILYYLLTDRPPFRGETLADTIHAVLHLDPVPPRSLRAGTPQDLETICLRCLEKRPSQRYRDAQEVEEELTRFLRREPILTRTLGLAEATRRVVHRHPRVAWLGLALLMLLLTGGKLASEAVGRLRSSEARERALRIRAEDARWGLARQLYAAHVREAGEAVQSGDLPRALALLGLYGDSSTEPSNRLANLRGWEWRYWINQCRSGSDFSLTSPEGPVGSVDFVDENIAIAVARGGALMRLDVAAGTLRTIRRSPSDSSETGTLSISPHRREIVVAYPLGPANRTRIERLSLPGLNTVDRFETDHRLEALGWDPPGEHPMGWVAEKETSAPGARLVKWGPSGAATPMSRFYPSAEPFVGAISDDGLRAAVADPNGNVRWADLLAGTESLLISSNRVNARFNIPNFLRFSPGDNYLVLVGFHSGAEVWDLSSSAPTLTLKERNKPVRIGEFSPDGQEVITAGPDQALRIWSSMNGHERRRLNGVSPTTVGMRCNPSGTRLISFDTQGLVQGWSLSPPEERDRISPKPDELVNTGLSDDGSSWWGVDANGRSHIEMVPSLRPRLPQMEASTTAVERVAFHPGMGLRAEINLEGGLVIGSVPSRTISPPTHAELGRPTSLVISPRGTRLAVGFETPPALGGTRPVGHLRLYSTTPPSPIGEWEGPSHVVVFSHDDRWMAAASRDGKAALFHLDDGTQRILGDPQGIVTTIAFSPDDRWIALGMGNGMVRICTVTGLAPVAQLNFGARRVSAGTFSPDGSRLVIGLEDGAIELWETGTWQKVASLFGHDSAIQALAFRTGDTLVSLAMDTLKEWRTDSSPQP